MLTTCVEKNHHFAYTNEVLQLTIIASDKMQMAPVHVPALPGGPPTDRELTCVYVAE